MCFDWKKLTGCLSAFSYWNTINTRARSNWFSRFVNWFSHSFRLLFVSFQMQVESNSLHDRARLFARIPPCIDLSEVTNCASETEKRWKSSNQTGSHFSKPLHVKTSNIENAVVVKMGADGLPIGELFALCLSTFSLNARSFIFRSARLDSTRSETVDSELGPRWRSWRQPHRWQVQDEWKGFVFDVGWNVPKSIPDWRENALPRLPA